jgi:hypothetical protein
VLYNEMVGVMYKIPKKHETMIERFVFFWGVALFVIYTVIFVALVRELFPFVSRPQAFSSSFVFDLVPTLFVVVGGMLNIVFALRLVSARKKSLRAELLLGALMSLILVFVGLILMGIQRGITLV